MIKILETHGFAWKKKVDDFTPEKKSTAGKGQTTVRCVTRGGEGGEVSPAFFQKLEKDTLICGEKCLVCGYLWVKFTFKM